MRHSRIFGSLIVAVLVLSAGWSTVGAQQAAPPAKPVPVALKVDVVLTRWQADKKIASYPFTLWPVASRGLVSVRVGVDVPVGTSTVTRNSGSVNQTNTMSTTSAATEYRNIGTSLDCSAAAAEGGGFILSLQVADSSLYSEPNAAAGTIRISDRAAFRTFNLSNTLTVRDGQTMQFGSATDKLTGETLKVDVTVNVVK